MHIGKVIPLLVTLVLSGAAFAQSQQAAVNEVQALVESGELDQALDAADRFIRNHPSDPRMRFLKGLIFTNQSKWDQAIEVFRKLANDFPELPAPLNNLAVVYAETGNYESARDVLIEAINIDPKYAAAHENLGDIYVTLAARSYQEALSMDSGKQTAGAKLRVLQQLVPETSPAETHADVATEAAGAPDSPVQAAVADRAMSREESRTASVDTLEDKVASEIGDVIRAWAAAWSAQDVDRYLGFYDPNFLPPDGKTVQQWRAERRARLSAPSYIRVSVQNIEPRYSDTGRATAHFVQFYESNTYRSTALKEFLLQRGEGGWKIVRETVRRER